MNQLRTKIIAAVLFIGALLIFIFQQGLYSSSNSQISPTPTPQDVKAQVLSSNPSDNETVLATQTIEINFNLPVENVGELKNKIDPATDFKIELSDNRKKARFIPQKPLTLGTGYTIVITGETKFDGGKRMDQDFILHFRTIEYKGI